MDPVPARLGGPASGPDGKDARGSQANGVLDRLLEVVDEVRQRSLDELSEQQLTDEVTRLDLAMRRLDARVSRATATIGDRQATRARQANVGADERGRERAAERARRQAERDLARAQQKDPGEVGRAAARGRQAASSSAAGDAYDRGELQARQASQLDETLKHIGNDADRAAAQEQLLAAATTQDPTTFGRTCRAFLAKLDHDAATRAEDARHRRRSASSWTTPDGMTALHGQWAAVDGHLITTAINAFRRHDAPGENRTAGQRFADALTEMAGAALRAGEAPTQHGVRPHVVITVAWETVLADAGVAYTDTGQPVPYAHVRRLLADCGVSRLLTDAKGIPVEAGIAVRTVNAGLFKELRVRDRVCIGDGCDIPAQFCQIMHLDVPFRFGGRLALESSGLGCAYHHHKLDHEGWKVTMVGGIPVLHHPARPPDTADRRPLAATSNSAPRREPTRRPSSAERERPSPAGRGRRERAAEPDRTKRSRPPPADRSGTAEQISLGAWPDARGP